MTPKTGGQWYSNSSAVTTDNPPGYAFGTTETGLFVKMDSVAYVGVSGGGTVKAVAPISTSGLKVDASTGGTVDGFTFAASGTLEVVGFDGQMNELPVTFQNKAGLENVQDWTVTGAGVPLGTKVKARDGRLRLVPPGTTLILR